MCRTANQCTATKGTCWCFNEPIPKALIALLKDSRDAVCICKNCVLKYKRAPEKFKI
ncbi:cysteine-rich CWC family protein [Paraglaciecola sp. 2405UD69-4]|uniref:cysteine-rich CWC family protein n=1 Tax=Paraglaciecola sp. 2405UD69-4 TaxID=3391836 RepID=UPI0039C901AD